MRPCRRMGLIAFRKISGVERLPMQGGANPSRSRNQQRVRVRRVGCSIGANGVRLLNPVPGPGGRRGRFRRDQHHGEASSTASLKLSIALIKISCLQRDVSSLSGPKLAEVQRSTPRQASGAKAATSRAHSDEIRHPKVWQQSARDVVGERVEASNSRTSARRQIAGPPFPC